jgi:predicted O-linked N-acetylglucosamine transferase (SPINDLY family)
MPTNTEAGNKPASEQVAGYLQQAIAHHQAGELQEAGELYRDILQAEPNHPEANHNMGVLAVQMKQPAAGLPYFVAALNAAPARRQYWLNYIDALLQAGQLEEARQMLTLARQSGLEGNEVEALAVRLEDSEQVAKQPNADNQHTSTGSHPSLQEINTLVAMFNEGRLTEVASLALAMTVQFPLHGFGWKALGLAFQQMGRSADALAPMQKAAELSPSDAVAHNNLGNILSDLGRLDEAEANLRRALQINPNYAEAHINLGATLYDLGRLGEAEASYRRALQINPDIAEAHYNLANALRELGRMDEAAASYRQALQIKPDYAEAHSNLGNILKDQGHLDEAEASFRRALQIKPDYAEAHSNLGNLLKDQGHLDEAEASFRRALQIKPNFAEAHNNLGNLLKDQGHLDEAEASYQRSLKIKPDYTVAHSNLIFTLDMKVGEDSSSLHEERKRWDAAHAAHLHQQRAHTNIPDPERRLRIGYVSADFRDHSAPKVFGGMLTRYDRSQFDVFAYSNSKGQGDRFTELFKQNVTAWRSIVGVSDEAVAEMIREDEIDILVDLSGHTAGNRLLVFARKPAPIQITAWGYATGTGMRAMDVFFTDPVMVPPNEKPYFTEEVRYLPSVVGAFFNEPFPDVNELPALSDGIITFGSLNRLTKVSAEAYRVWAEVLLAVPRSRLILKTPELNDAAVRERVAGHFTQAGVAAERIIMLGKSSWHEHMQAYNQIDMALDPFPHGGGVTALEGLMMGVPVITLRWPTVVGRLSASIMTTLGLTDWIAETQEQYVALAIRKASDLQSLAELRQQLRGMFTSSIIGDQVAYARAVEQEYRLLWQEWCASV